MRILVLGGGNSPERDVSLRSSKAVFDALISAGFEAEFIDTKDGLGFLSALPKDTIIFPILHGAEGEDGVIQAELEKLELPFLGSSSAASAKCFDKNISRRILLENNIPMPEGVSVNAQTYPMQELRNKPHVLKVQRGGSSIGTYLVPDPQQVDQAKIDEVFSLDSEAILEELIDNIEITVPILDGNAMPVIEIVPPDNGEFDYENKYNGKSQEICPAVSIDNAKQEEAQKLAEKVYEILGCRHLSRVDILVRENGSLAVLENNTMPGMTDQSLFPIAAKVVGMPMPKLMEKFVAIVKRDYQIN